METNDTTTTVEAPPSAAAPVTTGGPSFRNATKEGLKIISKGGVEVQQPQETPSTEAAKNISSNTPDTTSGNPSGQNNDANPPAASSAAAPVDTNPQSSTAAPQNQPPATPEPDLIALFKNRSGGKITTPDQAVALVDEVETLRTQLATRPQIEFPNDQARQIFEFAQKFPGYEVGAAKNLLHIQTLPIDKLEPKEAQFEAFALKKPNWTREQARQYFEEKYDRAYGPGVIETSVIAQLDHEEETRSAKAELTKAQQDFAAAKPSQPAGEQQQYQLTDEDRAEIQRDVEEVTKGFDGVRYQFVENDAESTVNVQMDKSRLQKLQTYLAEPGAFLNDLYEECKVNGKFSHAKLRDAMFAFMNRDAIHKQIFNQGKTYGEITIIKERKNTATQKTETGAPPVIKKPATMQEAWRAAHKARA